MNFVRIEPIDIPKVLELEKKRIGSSLSVGEVTESLLGENYVCIVAKEGEDLIGYVLSSISGNEAEIYSIVVKEEYEGQGIGHRLLDELTASLKKSGVSKVFLEVEDGNERAYRLYLHFGFVEYRRRVGYYDGKDAVCMEKEI